MATIVIMLPPAECDLQDLGLEIAGRISQKLQAIET